MTPLEMVREFHRAFGVAWPTLPAVPNLERQLLRINLITEESRETLNALEHADLIEIADGLADLVVVVYGTALEYGIDLDAVLEEVHRSNMAKLGPDGHPILRADGKVLKPEDWQPPDIAGVLGLQKTTADGALK